MRLDSLSLPFVAKFNHLTRDERTLRLNSGFLMRRISI